MCRDLPQSHLIRNNCLFAGNLSYVCVYVRSNLRLSKLCVGTKGKGEDVSTQSVLSTVVYVFDHTPALAAGGQHNKATRENRTQHYCYNETMT